MICQIDSTKVVIFSPNAKQQGIYFFINFDFTLFVKNSHKYAISTVNC